MDKFSILIFCQVAHDLAKEQKVLRHVEGELSAIEREVKDGGVYSPENAERQMAYDASNVAAKLSKSLTGHEWIPALLANEKPFALGASIEGAWAFAWVNLGACRAAVASP